MEIRFNLPSARLRRLIGHGYFPAELPPPFTSAGFANHVAEFASSWDGEKIGRKFQTRPESYSMPRYGHARRMLSIVNPVNQCHVSNLISKNWSTIRQRLKRSKITEFDAQILMRGSGRAVTGVNFDGVSLRRAAILGSYGSYVKTDIARFYHSIYTHSIPWAIHGKSWVKENRNTPEFKLSFGNLLDQAVASGQDGQTIGIPIGPDTSRIISELIVSEIEEITKTLLPDLNQRAVRFVDDFLIGFNETESTSKILSALSMSLYDFELELNSEKTVIHGIGYTHPQNWIHYIRTFELSTKAWRQNDDLDSFFEQAFFLADANPRDNVLLFAVKRAAGFVIDSASIPHLVRWLLYATRRSPSCLRFVAEHLAAIKPSDPMSEGEIQAYILQQIPLKAEAVHTDEVAWLLFWAREIGLKIPSAILKEATTLRSSVVAMLVLDLNQKGLIEGQIDDSLWRSSANQNGLRSELWLVAYEATKRGWWPGIIKTSFITGHPYFSDIWNKDVNFYDPDKKAREEVKPAFLTVVSGGTGGGSSGYP